MTSTYLPTQPAPPLTVLAESYATLRRVGTMTSAIAMLVEGTAITQRIDADRWQTVMAALTEGAALADVAEAMDTDIDGVCVGLTMWAVDQRLSKARYGEIVALACIGDQT